MTSRHRQLPPEERKKRDDYILKREAAGANKAQIAREIGWSTELVKKVIRQHKESV
jgi:transposase-like protein